LCGHCTVPVTPAKLILEQIFVSNLLDRNPLAASTYKVLPNCKSVLFGYQYAF
jgi:hypothetical protein